eukprot:350391-Chlamydomonas_euryale.AAC.2
MVVRPWQPNMQNHVLRGGRARGWEGSSAVWKQEVEAGASRITPRLYTPVGPIHTCGACTHLWGLYTPVGPVHTCGACTHLRGLYTPVGPPDSPTACAHLCGFQEQRMTVSRSSRHTTKRCSTPSCIRPLALAAPRPPPGSLLLFWLAEITSATRSYERWETSRPSDRGTAALAASPPTPPAARPPGPSRPSSAAAAARTLAVAAAGAAGSRLALLCSVPISPVAHAHTMGSVACAERNASDIVAGSMFSRRLRMMRPSLRDVKYHAMGLLSRYTTCGTGRLPRGGRVGVRSMAIVEFRVGGNKGCPKPWEATVSS